MIIRLLVFISSSSRSTAILPYIRPCAFVQIQLVALRDAECVVPGLLVRELPVDAEIHRGVDVVFETVAGFFICDFACPNVAVVEEETLFGREAVLVRQRIFLH